jgi:uncharacterized membrane protein YkoI
MLVRTLILSALLAGSAYATPVGAGVQIPLVQSQYFQPAQDRRGGQDIRPLRDVVDELRSSYGGELISARLEQGPSPVYVLRWRMPDGQVRDFRVSAAR